MLAEQPGMNRRKYLTAIAGGAALLAGCSDNEQESTEQSPEESATDSPTDSSTANTRTPVLEPQTETNSNKPE